MADINMTLDQLTDAEKRSLYTSLSYEFRPGAKITQESFSADESLIWDAINDVVGFRRNLGDVLVKCGREYTRASFAEDVESVMDYIDRGSRTKLTKTQRLALVNCAMTKLSARLFRGHLPVTHRTLIQQLPSLPDSLDRAFPGYAGSGLLNRAVAMY